MKYEDEIVRENNEAHNIILSQIKPGSKVLEFGPAGGRMTKILQEEYHCRVFIVEYEQEAYNRAIRFAVAGLCDDIENLKWKSIWQNEMFDYIIFADVLEHLKSPYTVLNETVELLKDDGIVLISIPNIAHNDVLAKMYFNHFDYTDIGILDATHLHFWAEENLDEFEKNTEYKLLNVFYKTVPTRTTEQFRAFDSVLPEELSSLFYTRVNGEVYQFILKLQKKDFIKKVELKIPDKIYGHIQGRIYFDRGDGFHQEDSKTVAAYWVNSDQFELNFEIKLERDVKAIRYDPLEGQACIINSVEFKQEGKEVEVPIQNNGVVDIDGKIFLNSSDPQVIFLINNMKNICLKVNFSISKKTLCHFIELYNCQRNLKNERLICELKKNRDSVSELKIINENLNLIKQENEKNKMELIATKQENKKNEMELMRLNKNFFIRIQKKLHLL